MDRRLRLLVVSETLSEGGAERFVSTLLTHLDRERFEPALCLLRDVVTYPLADGVPVTCVDHRGPRTIRRTIRGIARLIDRTDADLVLSNIAFTSGFVGPALRRRPRPRWIARVGNDPRTPRGWWGLSTRAWLRWAYRRADRFVANSRGLAAAFERHYPSAAGRTGSLANPVDFDRVDRLAARPPDLRADPGVPVLASVGRLHLNKRLDVMLRAFEIVRRRRPAALWICGDGPLRDEVRETIARLGLEGSVRLLGFLDNPFALLRQAELFLLTSDHEGSPNALIEAQGLGLAAVATRCPYGPEEIVEDGVTGRLVATGDPRAVADAVDELLDDPEARRRLGRAAAESARRRFDAAKAVAGWQELFEVEAASRR